MSFTPETPMLEAVVWNGETLTYIDQRLLPHEVRRVRAEGVDDIEAAIKTLAVRGAPAIGVFGAYGVAILRDSIANDEAFLAAAQRVRNARPTAVNLAWAVDRVLASGDMLAEAQAIHREQVAMDAAIADAGLDLIGKNANIITHCNTGPIATAGGGTALGVIIHAHRAGKKPHVFVDETRPLLQGSRLTYFELAQAGVDATLQVDGAAAIAMARKAIDLVIVGADRIARNGDTANKIGTYALAILAAHHSIPFYVAAPRSTIDFSMANGAGIHIEERAPQEVTSFGGAPSAPADTRVYNPAFDVTPGHLVTAFVTEYGVIRPPYLETISALEGRPSFSALVKK
ncbi:MAG TPA: S-methyl-5-thioribose-1-phosphate isomerase [Candidatus Baltobacteraceae bacterium]|jgi:methylthioribose-1-phosphate isomerase|nr:S-methyl-5-thioribose-1-phosphate isomerase [Candidatus Baltobacteraceae bacterium]